MARRYFDRSSKVSLNVVDLEKAPGEYDNLWDSPDHTDAKLDLLQRSFDASMLAMDRGPERIGPM